MRISTWVVMLLLLLALCGTTYTACDTEARATRWQARAIADADQWQDRVAGVDAVMESNLQISAAYGRNAFLLKTVSTLATQNGYLCERDEKAMDAVAEFDEENRRLKTALAEACRRLEEQTDELNELMGEISDLYYKLAVLEQALDRIPPVTDINITVPDPK